MLTFCVIINLFFSRWFSIFSCEKSKEVHSVNHKKKSHYVNSMCSIDYEIVSVTHNAMNFLNLFFTKTFVNRKIHCGWWWYDQLPGLSILNRPVSTSVVMHQFLCGIYFYNNDEVTRRAIVHNLNVFSPGDKTDNVKSPYNISVIA